MKGNHKAGAFFKQKSYLLALVLMLAAVFGMTGVYLSEQKQEDTGEVSLVENNQEQDISLAKNSETVQEQAEESQEEATEVDAVISPENDDFMDNPEVVSTKDQELAETEEEISQEAADISQPEAETAETVSQAQELHFDGADLMWPLSGDVLMDYSMDQTVYFATLDQYKYNPALVIQGAVNDKVLAVARGQVEEISTNEETGLTMTVDLGDGYEAVYGQLKETAFSQGDIMEAGDILGYVSEPTKYYSLEGPNLYFQLLKDGEPTDPMEYLQ